MNRISALMDGELDERQAREELARLRRHDELRENWDMFHLIGDALRGECLLSSEFNRRLSERLAQEPTVLAPHRRMIRRISTYALTAAASLSAIGLVGWVAISTNTVSPPPQVVRAPTPPAVLSTPAPTSASASQPTSVPDEGRMNEYLLAHQGFSPSTAIQGVAPYIRSVSSSQPAKNR